MDQRGWNRRKILSFFGLGVAGTVGASIFYPDSKGSDATPKIQSTQSKQQGSHPPGQALPEFVGISQWLNSSPLAIADLKGKVTLVQFWAFGCINSQRTLPYMTAWHRQYAAQGLQVIGVHTPEFDYERDANNVKEALTKYGITYPVALDNGYQTWKAYKNRYWPHLFLSNRSGELVYHHIGEGAYEETEQTIQILLG